MNIIKNEKTACCQGEMDIPTENQRKNNFFLHFGGFSTLIQQKKAVLHAQIPSMLRFFFYKAGGSLLWEPMLWKKTTGKTAFCMSAYFSTKPLQIFK